MVLGEPLGENSPVYQGKKYNTPNQFSKEGHALIAWIEEQRILCCFVNT